MWSPCCRATSVFTGTPSGVGFHPRAAGIPAAGRGARDPYRGHRPHAQSHRGRFQSTRPDAARAHPRPVREDDGVSEVTLTPSPFVGAVEPITETDEEIRARLDDAEIPPLLPALAYLTGDLSLLRDDLRPDPMLVAHAAGRTDRRATGRRRASSRSRRSSVTATVAAGPRRCRPTKTSCASWSTRSAAPRSASTCRCSRRSSRPGVKIAARRAGPRPRSRPTTTFQVLDHRCRHVGPAGRAPTAAGRRRLRRSSRRTTTSADVVREHVSGVPGRQPEPQLQLLVRAAARLAVALLDAGRAARLPPAIRRRVRPADPHSVAHRGAVGDVVGRGSTVVGARAHPDGDEEIIEANAVISAVGQLNRPSFPTSPAATRSPAQSFHSARWRHDVELTRQTCRGHRHRRCAVQFIPEIAPEVRRAARVPAHATMDRADRGLPRRGVRRSAVALRGTCRRTANGTASGSSGAWATACSTASASTATTSRRVRPSACSTTSHGCCSPTISSSNSAFSSRLIACAALLPSDGPRTSPGTSPRSCRCLPASCSYRT